MLRDHLWEIFSMFKLSETSIADYEPSPVTENMIASWIDQNPLIFSSEVTETRVNSVLKLSNLTWEKLIDEKAGLFFPRLINQFSILIDFGDVIFLGSWDKIGHLLQPWRSFKLGHTIKTIGGYPVYKSYYREILTPGHMICEGTIDICLTIGIYLSLILKVHQLLHSIVSIMIGQISRKKSQNS